MSNQNCIFCNIVSGHLPSDIVYRDNITTAFREKYPIAPVHILIVPNQHFDSMNQLNENQKEILGHLLITARQIAIDQGVEETGYRVVINTGPDARQSVFHLHLHLIAGKPLEYHVR